MVEEGYPVLDLGKDVAPTGPLGQPEGRCDKVLAGGQYLDAGDPGESLRVLAGPVSTTVGTPSSFSSWQITFAQFDLPEPVVPRILTCLRRASREMLAAPLGFESSDVISSPIVMDLPASDFITGG